MCRIIRTSALNGLLAIGLAFVAPVQAEPLSGQKLHAEKCVACHKAPHNDEFYTSRVGKNYKTRDSLRTMVQACANHFNIDWFDEEVDAVTQYLDKQYYKF